MSDALTDYGPPGPVPGEHGGLLRDYGDGLTRPGTVKAPTNFRGASEVMPRRLTGGCIGGGDSHGPPPERKRRKP